MLLILFILGSGSLSTRMFNIQKKNKASLYTGDLIDMLVDGSCPAEVDGRWQLEWRDGRWWKIMWKIPSKLDYHLRDILVEEQSPSLISNRPILYFPGNGRQPGRWWKMSRRSQGVIFQVVIFHQLQQDSFHIPAYLLGLLYILMPYSSYVY